MLDPALPRQGRTTLQAGTALFLVSDSLLAIQTFLLPRPRPLLESAVMATYTVGQGLIAAGVAGATRRTRSPSAVVRRFPAPGPAAAGT